MVDSNPWGGDLCTLNLVVRTRLVLVGGLLTVVGCDETLLEDGGETCRSGVSWTGIELETQGSELRVRACVEDFCVRRSVAIVGEQLRDSH